MHEKAARRDFSSKRFLKKRFPPNESKTGFLKRRYGANTP
jgi:hypothetical protein